MTRQDVLDQLAGRISALEPAHPVRVAIDGVDAAGKTMLADELARVLGTRARPVIRASIDGFHRPRAERYRQGADSPEGYYADSFDVAALRAHLLLPLGPGGSRRVRRAMFDFVRDTALPGNDEVAPRDAVLLFDGVFLLRPELIDVWDYRIFVDVPFAVALERARQRDRALFGSTEAVDARYLRRYLPGQRIYLESDHPREQADAIVDNADLATPELIFAKLE